MPASGQIHTNARLAPMCGERILVQRTYRITTTPYWRHSHFASTNTRIPAPALLRTASIRVFFLFRCFVCTLFAFPPELSPRMNVCQREECVERLRYAVCASMRAGALRLRFSNTIAPNVCRCELCYRERAADSDMCSSRRHKFTHVCDSLGDVWFTLLRSLIGI